jgi:hypothetical protein
LIAKEDPRTGVVTSLLHDVGYQLDAIPDNLADWKVAVARPAVPQEKNSGGFARLDLCQLTDCIERGKILLRARKILHRMRKILWSRPQIRAPAAIRRMN